MGSMPVSRLCRKVMLIITGVVQIRMGKMKKGLVAAAGIVVGIIAVRKLRGGSDKDDELTEE